jgi:hypothetical protein
MPDVVQRLVAHVAAFCLFASLAVVGGRTTATRLHEAIEVRRAGARLVPPEIEQAVTYIRGQLPRDAPVILVTDDMDGWVNGVWQRAFYPNSALLFYKRDLGSQTMRHYRTSNRISYAVSMGNPPPNPGFVWQKPVPWTNQKVVFGEIEP